MWRLPRILSRHSIDQHPLQSVLFARFLSVRAMDTVFLGTQSSMSYSRSRLLRNQRFEADLVSCGPTVIFSLCLLSAWLRARWCVEPIWILALCKQVTRSSRYKSHKSPSLAMRSSNSMFPRASYLCRQAFWCVFICNWIKKRRKPRANNVTLKLWRVREVDKPLIKDWCLLYE